MYHPSSHSLVGQRCPEAARVPKISLLLPSRTLQLSVLSNAGRPTRQWGRLPLPPSWGLHPTAWAAAPLPSGHCWPYHVGKHHPIHLCALHSFGAVLTECAMPIPHMNSSSVFRTRVPSTRLLEAPASACTVALLSSQVWHIVR